MADQPGLYTGYPSTNKWSIQSRQLAQSSAALRSHVQQNIVSDNQYEIDRITKYYLYWKFYEGLHYKDFNDGILSFNYVRSFIDKVSMFLLGETGFSLTVKKYSTEQVDREVARKIEQFYLYHWNRSRRATLSHEMLQMGGVSGDLWVAVEWDNRKKFARIKTLDSRQCFPYFKDGNYENLERFVVRIPLEQTDKQPYKLQCIAYTEDKIEMWKQKVINYRETERDKFEKSSVPNPYGFIPVVHIKNKPFSPSYYSKSDAADIIKINKVFNEMMQEQKAILDYYATPTTVITGGSAKNLRRGLGNIWSGLPPEANVFNLGLDVDMGAADNYLQRLKTSMHELSDVPENALGKLQAISNTSAAALQITYQPLMQQAQLKALTYGDGIAEINDMLPKIVEAHDPGNPLLKALMTAVGGDLDDIRVEPVFGYGLPQDQQAELNNGLAELNARIASRREVMARLGKNNITELLEEINEDQIEMGMLNAAIQQFTAPPEAAEGGAE